MNTLKRLSKLFSKQHKNRIEVDDIISPDIKKEIEKINKELKILESSRFPGYILPPPPPPIKTQLQRQQIINEISVLTEVVKTNNTGFNSNYEVACLANNKIKELMLLLH